MLRKKMNVPEKTVQQAFSMNQSDLGRIVTLAYSTILYTRDRSKESGKDETATRVIGLLPLETAETI